MRIHSKFGLCLTLAIATALVSGCTSTTSNVAALEEPALTAPGITPVPAQKPDMVAALAPGEEAPIQSLVAEAEAASEPAVDIAAAQPEAAGAEIDVAAADELDPPSEGVVAFVASKLPGAKSVSAFSGGGGARNCLMRAMYFESNRSSREGQLAVGTVVMHRVASGRYGRSVCGVVGARGQFAPGVMSRRMQGDTSDLAKLADSILRGKRHPRLAKNVMFFHQAGLRFPYKNMRYVLTAGGNTFYYKAARAKRRR